MNLLNGEPKTKWAASREVVILIANVDVFDVELYSSKKASDEAKHGRLFEFLWIFISLSLCLPSSRISIPFCDLFVVFLKQLLPYVGSGLLSFGLVV